MEVNSDVPVMKGRKSYCLKEDLRPFITETSNCKFCLQLQILSVRCVCKYIPIMLFVSTAIASRSVGKVE